MREVRGSFGEEVEKCQAEEASKDPADENEKRVAHLENLSFMLSILVSPSRFARK